MSPMFSRVLLAACSDRGIREATNASTHTPANCIQATTSGPRSVDLYHGFFSFCICCTASLYHYWLDPAEMALLSAFETNHPTLRLLCS